MRRCYLVCYDIREAKRLRKVHKTMKAYGEPWQYSVFYCTLKDIDRVRMQSELEDVMNHKKDQIVIIDLGGNDRSAREAVTTLGPKLPEAESGVVVI